MVLDSTLAWQDADGFTNAVTGVMSVNPSLSSEAMKSTVAHEGGHLRFLFLGHDFNASGRFDNPARVCQGIHYPRKDEAVLRSGECSCD